MMELFNLISLFWPAVKILEWLLLPSIVTALGTLPSQQGFKLRHSTASALLPISANVVFGFNQRKPPSRTITIAVDNTKVFDTMSHHLIEMIHLSWLDTTWWGGLWCGVPPQQEGFIPLSGRGPTGISHLPSPLQPLCIGKPNPWLRHDVLCWRLHVAGLCPQHRGGWGRGKPTMLLFGEVGLTQQPELCLGRPCFSSSDVLLFCWAAFLSFSLLASVFPVSLPLFFLFLRPCLIHARMPDWGRAFVHGHTFLHSWSGPMTLVVGLLHGSVLFVMCCSCPILPTLVFVSFI